MGHAADEWSLTLYFPYAFGGATLLMALTTLVDLAVAVLIARDRASPIKICRPVSNTDKYKTETHRRENEMRSKPGKVLRKEFKTRLSAGFPGFVLDKSVVMPPAWDVYKWEIAGGFWAYFVLAISPKDDRFTVEVAWTRKEEYPSRYDLRRGEEAERDQECFRLPELCEPYRDRWWHLVKQTSIWDDAIFDLLAPEEPVEMAVARIPGALDEVFEQIRQYAIPYLISQSARQG